MASLLVIVSLLLCLSDGRATQLSNPSPVKTIRSEDGDVIDCVDIYKQPSLQHPLLKDHVIQMKPSTYPKEHEQDFEDSLSTQRSRPRQVWHKSASCPHGTVPILRPKVSVDQGTLARSMIAVHYNGTSLSSFNQPPREYASVSPKNRRGYGYFGARGTINVWNPFTEVPGEFSSSRMCFAAPTSAPIGEMIFAGVHVYGQLYGDNATRLFIDWQTSNNPGCYNLHCPGFILVNQSFPLGAQVQPVSTYEGQQYVIKFIMHKDFNTNNWWLSIDDVDVGYWPASLFTSLKNFAEVCEWGGELLNTNPGGRHTKTQMGNGHFPQHQVTDSPGRSAYFAYTDYINGDGDWQSIFSETDYITKPNCYGYQNTRPFGGFGPKSKYSFFFGGPGGSDPGCN